MTDEDVLIKRVGLVLVAGAVLYVIYDNGKRQKVISRFDKLSYEKYLDKNIVGNKHLIDVIDETKKFIKDHLKKENGNYVLNPEIPVGFIINMRQLYEQALQLILIEGFKIEVSSKNNRKRLEEMLEPLISENSGLFKPFEKIKEKKLIEKFNEQVHKPDCNKSIELAKSEDLDCIVSFVHETMVFVGNIQKQKE